MERSFALVGNPNSGKTTLFNQLTGSHQHVGNWPGVTVEKKTGTLKDDDQIQIVDLPGIYSLSPYSNEEIIARDFLSKGQVDVIIDIVDATNIERNLYLTTQLLEFGVPVVIALNQMDIVQKRGQRIETSALSEAFSVPVVEISALTGEGVDELVAKALVAVKTNAKPVAIAFPDEIEQLIAHLEENLPDFVPESLHRFYAIKYLEGDKRVIEMFGAVPDLADHGRAVEARFGDKADAVITNERYDLIVKLLGNATQQEIKRACLTERIDKVLLNRVLALPIFAVIIVMIYYIAISTVGTNATDWVNDGLFGDGYFVDPIAIVDPDAGAQGRYDEAVESYEAAQETIAQGVLVADPGEPSEYGLWIPGIPAIVGPALEAVGCVPWLYDLIMNGIIAGVGSVLGFVPQIMILFFLLAILEGCGYMARVTFILDRIFRCFGLSGKSFIPMIIGTGCGVPGIMASRTIESESSRHLTVMTTTFMPCSAKLPIIALISTAIFGGVWWVAPLCYFMGIASIVMSGIILKKFKSFRGETTPYIMELPEYRLPRFVDLLRSMWERAWAFIKKAGTIILAAVIVVWFLSNYGIYNGQFMNVGEGLMDYSFLAYFGNAFAWIFTPLGFANWQSASSVITGLIAKENVIGAMAVLFGGTEVAWSVNFMDSLALLNGTTALIPVAAFSFMTFQLLCCPCFAAMGAIKSEIGGFNKWFWAAIGWECLWAYCIALMIFQFGRLVLVGAFDGWTLLACGVAILLLVGLFRPIPKDKTKSFYFGGISAQECSAQPVFEGCSGNECTGGCAGCASARTCSAVSKNAVFPLIKERH